MTRDEFINAARERRPVRLADRSLCYLRNEWYLPEVSADGKLTIETGREPPIEAGRDLLAELRTAGPAPTTVRRLLASLRTLDPATRVVVRGQAGGFEDVRTESVETVRIAVEAGCGEPGADRHGPEDEAGGEHDPIETAIVIGSGPGSRPGATD